MPDDNTSPPPQELELIPKIQTQFLLLEQRFAQLKAEVRQAMQLSTLGTATAVWAHELHNLITPMLSYAQYALAGNDVELMKKALSITVANSRTVMAMSDRILGLSARKTTPIPENVAVAPAVEHAAECLGRDLNRDGINLTVDVPPQLQAWIDPHCFQQILFNLILNARDAMATTGGGQLTIKARGSDRDEVTMTVADTGPGIPREQLDHVFDPFISTKPATREGKVRCGGVGLSVSRDLIEEAGGQISVESKPGRGTVFLIRLPGRPR